MVTFIIIFMLDIFTSCCKMKNTLCFKKELYVVVVKVRAISLRKMQQFSWVNRWLHIGGTKKNSFSEYNVDSTQMN